MIDNREKWRCQDCDYVTDVADRMTMHGANTDHAYCFGTAELRNLLVTGRERLEVERARSGSEARNG